jgi:hypothetical protein
MSVDHETIGQVHPTRFMSLYRRNKRGAVEPVLEFLRGGGDPNLRYRQYGETLLHAACSKGIQQLVEALVAAGTLTPSAVKVSRHSPVQRTVATPNACG